MVVNQEAGLLKSCYSNLQWFPRRSFQIIS